MKKTLSIIISLFFLTLSANSIHASWFDDAKTLIFGSKEDIIHLKLEQINELAEEIKTLNAELHGELTLLNTIRINRVIKKIKELSEKQVSLLRYAKSQNYQDPHLLSDLINVLNTVAIDFTDLLLAYEKLSISFETTDEVQKVYSLRDNVLEVTYKELGTSMKRELNKEQDRVLNTYGMNFLLRVK